MADLKRNVEQIRKKRGITQAALSSRVGMSIGELNAFLETPPARKETTIKKISRELLVPDVLLFAEDADVRDIRIPDFRLSEPTARQYSRETLRWIEFAESIRETAEEVGTAQTEKQLSSIINDNHTPKHAAAALREALAFTYENQLSFKDARTMFAALRQRVESLNIFVLQLSFPTKDGTGFCISDSNYNVIVINTRKQIPARRSFTLAHEIYHCAIGRSGLSDSFRTNNAIERRCNTFAAHFLAPDELVRHIAGNFISSNELNLDELRKIAHKLNISMHATLLRLVELGIYRDTAISAWQSHIANVGDPEAPKTGGGQRVEEWKYKLSRYGFKFATVFGRAIENDVFDDLEFYRFSGIKPKFQKAYIENASFGRAEDADVDEGVESD